MSTWKNPLVVEFSNYMGLDPVNAIKKECNFLLNRANAKKKLPIDIDSISEKLGLKDKKYLYGKIGASAFIEKTSKNELKIRLDKNSPNLYRYRFSIAHEIGHILIRNKINKKFSDKQQELISRYHYEEEALCQFAASEILLPEDSLLPLIKDKLITPKIIGELSKKYQVSLISVLNRVAYLLKNRICIYWKYRSSDNSYRKALRVTWFFPKPNFKKVPFIPLNATAKNERFSPNIFLKSYQEVKSLHGQCFVSDFGGISGQVNICTINPREEISLFPQNNLEKKSYQYDLYSIIKY